MSFNSSATACPSNCCLNSSPLSLAPSPTHHPLLPTAGSICSQTRVTRAPKGLHYNSRGTALSFNASLASLTHSSCSSEPGFQVPFASPTPRTSTRTSPKFGRSGPTKSLGNFNPPVQDILVVRANRAEELELPLRVQIPPAVRASPESIYFQAALSVSPSSVTERRSSQQRCHMDSLRRIGCFR